MRAPKFARASLNNLGKTFSVARAGSFTIMKLGILGLGHHVYGDTLNVLIDNLLKSLVSSSFHDTCCAPQYKKAGGRNARNKCFLLVTDIVRLFSNHDEALHASNSAAASAANHSMYALEANTPAVASQLISADSLGGNLSAHRT